MRAAVGEVLVIWIVEAEVEIGDEAGGVVVGSWLCRVAVQGDERFGRNLTTFAASVSIQLRGKSMRRCLVLFVAIAAVAGLVIPATYASADSPTAPSGFFVVGDLSAT
ncbi:MAG: hypothetical protein ACLPVY_00250, partial [Acidimicrobiia bacterium]